MLYQFKHSTAPKVVGKTYPQIQRINEDYDTESHLCVGKINPWEELSLNLIPPLYYLHKQAKRTDLLSAAVQHFHLLIISPILKEIILEHKIPHYQLYEAKIIKEGFYDYFIFYIPAISIEFINFEKSTFCLAKTIMRTKIEPVEINSLEEFQREASKYPRPNPLCIAVDKLVFLEDIPYDMFRILGLVSGYFVNEKLKDAIEKAGLTGMEFVPIEKMETVF